MSDSIFLDREFVTNGARIPAGKVTTEDLRDLMKDDNGVHITEEQAKSVQQDLLRRQARYAVYSKGVHERTEYAKDSGSMAMGGGSGE